MAENVALRVALQEERAAELAARVARVLSPLDGDERALDAGCGAGALAFALAPLVREVVGVDLSAGLLEAARERAPANCSFVEADVTALPFDWGEFDLAGCLRVLHHVHRPELVVSELARVTRPAGRILVVDQLGSIDPMKAIELDRFERARDPSHQRLLPDGDIRALLEANDLVVLGNEVVREQRDVERYVALVDLPDAERERVRRMAPAPVYEIEVGWYVARKHGA
ncbi:MAG TPA: methyltransferase domain-containing protein [Gaiellaceae bacterium]|jgi:SAM-dependent methyltransferase